MISEKPVGRRLVVLVVAVSLFLVTATACTEAESPGRISRELNLPEQATVYSIDVNNDGTLILGTGLHGVFVGSIRGSDVVLTDNFTEDGAIPIVGGAIRTVRVEKDYYLAGGQEGLTILERGDEGDVIEARWLLPGNIKAVAVAEDFYCIGIYPGGVVTGILENGQLKDISRYHRRTTPQLLGRQVTALAMDESKEVLLIASDDRGVAVADVDPSQALLTDIARLPTVTSDNLASDDLANLRADDLAMVHGLIVLGTHNGLSTAKLKNNVVEVLRSYTMEDLPGLTVRRVYRVALNRAGTKVAFGGHTGDVVVADIDNTGTISNPKTLASAVSATGPSQLRALSFSSDGQNVLIGTSRSGLSIVPVPPTTP